MFATDAWATIVPIADRAIDAARHADSRTWLGVATAAALLIFYALESASPLFAIAFAVACLAGSGYGYLRNSPLIEIVGVIWACFAIGKSWRRTRSQKVLAANTDHLSTARSIHILSAFSVLSAIFLLVVDSPFGGPLTAYVSRQFVEATPLLVVGLAYLIWLSIDRPSIANLIKQLLIAIAFILWGVDLLIPTGQWSRFLAAVVIAIYVIDLAWLMHGSLRKKLAAREIEPRHFSPDSQSPEVCCCGATCLGMRQMNNGLHQPGTAVTTVTST